MNRLLSEINVAIQRFEYFLPSLFGRFPQPPGKIYYSKLGKFFTSSTNRISILVNFAFQIEAPTSSHVANNISKPFSVKDLIGDGFLWAVPKFRRSVERRMKRRFGSPGLNMKYPQVKNYLVECEYCGDFYEPKSICATCYDKVRQETNSIKDKIMKKIGLSPDDKEVVVLYDGEKGESSSEFWNGKRIVEMEKPRPNWFSKNLLQKSTKEVEKATKTVKPDELG